MIILSASKYSFNFFYSAIKWKEKVDLMCCLPNKFPMPILLLVTNLYQFETQERTKKLEAINFNSYVLENQYYEKYLLANCDEVEDKSEHNEEQENLIDGEGGNNENRITYDFCAPFDTIAKFVFEFDDIKSKFFGQNDLKKYNTNESTNKDKKKGNCLIF